MMFHSQPDPSPSGTGSPRITSKPQRALNKAAVSASSASAASFIASSAAGSPPRGAPDVSVAWSSSEAPATAVAPTPSGEESQNASSSAVTVVSSPGPHSRRAVGCERGRRAATTRASFDRRSILARGRLRFLVGEASMVVTPRGRWGVCCRHRGSLADRARREAASLGVGEAGDPGVAPADATAAGAAGVGKEGKAWDGSWPVGGGVAMMDNSGRHSRRVKGMRRAERANRAHAAGMAPCGGSEGGNGQGVGE